MANRTADLPPLPGLPGVIRELRHQEAMRQGLGLALMPVFAWFSSPAPVPFMAGAFIVVLGCLVRVYASGYIVKNKQLATDGPYSLVRHPLYTGNLLVLIGFTLACGQWWAPLVAIAFWWFYYPTAISYEDRKLHRIFGEPWEQWSRSVPAVIPRRFWPAGPASWSFMTSVRQNAEPVVIAFTLICIGWIGARV
ncbi:MAG: isoprenylcysteine carboxylmethyltransferase family protein [Gammaproteobacteria bacterium]